MSIVYGKKIDSGLAPSNGIRLRQKVGRAEETELRRRSKQFLLGPSPNRVLGERKSTLRKRPFGGTRDLGEAASSQAMIFSRKDSLAEGSLSLTSSKKSRKS